MGGQLVDENGVRKPPSERVVTGRTMVDGTGEVIEDLHWDPSMKRSFLFRLLPRKTNIITEFWFLSNEHDAREWREINVGIPDLRDTRSVSIDLSHVEHRFGVHEELGTRKVNERKRDGCTSVPRP